MWQDRVPGAPRWAVCRRGRSRWCSTSWPRDSQHRCHTSPGRGPGSPAAPRGTHQTLLCTGWCRTAHSQRSSTSCPRGSPCHRCTGWGRQHHAGLASVGKGRIWLAQLAGSGCSTSPHGHTPSRCSSSPCSSPPRGCPGSLQQGAGRRAHPGEGSTSQHRGSCGQTGSTSWWGAWGCSPLPGTCLLCWGQAGRLAAAGPAVPGVVGGWQRGHCRDPHGAAGLRQATARRTGPGAAA